MSAVKEKTMKLVLGSNILSGFEKIFDIDNQDVLNIINDDIPRITLLIPFEGGWVKIVDNNSSNSPILTIIESLSDKKVEFKLRNKIILSLFKNDEDTLYIDKLDLRELGLNIFIENNSLKIGNATFSGNTFKNVNTIFKL